MCHQQTTSIDPHALGQQYNLGNFKKKYRQFSMWGPVAFLSYIAIFMVTTFWFVGSNNYKLGLLRGPIDVIPGIIAFLLGVGCLIYIFNSMIPSLRKELREGRLDAYLYEQGFIACTSKGIVQRVIRWADIGVRHERVADSDGGRVDVYTVIDRNTGEQVGLNFGVRFGQAVSLAVAHHQYPSAQTAYLSGNNVHFGRLAVSLQGLYDTETSTRLSWNDIERIKIGDPVCIKQKGQRRNWASFPLGQLVNAATLRRLLEADAPHCFAFQNRIA